MLTSVPAWRLRRSLAPVLELVVAERRSEPGVAGYRARFERLAVHLPTSPDVAVVHLDADGAAVEQLTSPTSSPDRYVLYLHGGGFVAGSAATHRSLAAEVGRRAGAVTVNVDYRRAPEHPFPAALDDVVAAYRWLLRSGADPARVVLAGDSAGGGLAVSALVALRDAGVPLPAGAACLSPWVDLGPGGPSRQENQDADVMVRAKGLARVADMYLAGRPATTPLASPVHADLRGLPPLLVQVSPDELLWSDGVLLARRAREAGVRVRLDPWPGMIHLWQGWWRLVPEADAAVDGIAAFARRAMGAERAAR